jgi:hypothetical protein
MVSPVGPPEPGVVLLRRLGRFSLHRSFDFRDGSGSLEFLAFELLQQESELNLDPIYLARVPRTSETGTPVVFENCCRLCFIVIARERKRRQTAREAEKQQ